MQVKGIIIWSCLIINIVPRILYLLDDISELIGEIQLDKLPSDNETISIVIPCGYFARGGIYALRVEYKYKNSTVPVASLYQVVTFFSLAPTYNVRNFDITNSIVIHRQVD